MVRHRARFLSIAVALFTAIVMVAAWTSAGATDAPAANVERDTANLRPAATDEGGPLVWRPAGFGAAAEKAHDLCDDAAAIEAGLDGGALAEDRQSMGIDCADRNSELRYGYLTDAGVLALGRSPRDAKAAARDIVGDGDDKLTAAAPGRTLGHFGLSVTAPAAADEVQLVPGSLSAGDGITRGLVQNLSDSMFARGVTVSAGGATWQVPLTLQPGETAPFEIAGEATTVAIESALTPEADLDRSILLTGAPGHWYGNSRDFPGLDGIVTDVPDGDIHYFESFVEVREPASHPSLASAIRDRAIANPTAHVAFVDADGAVLDVIEVEVRRFDGASDTDGVDEVALGGSYVIGFLVPDDAADFAVWIGGAK